MLDREDIMENNSTLKNEVSRELIAEADQAELQVQRTTLSFFDSDLEELDENDLMERFECIDNQAALYKWKICMLIRDRFLSDKLMGQFLKKYRDEHPTHPLSKLPQQTMNKFVAAARFCMKHGIKSLEAAGIQQTSIFYLSSPINRNIADDIYAKIKGKNIPSTEVKHMIKQANVVLTIEKGTDHDLTNDKEYPETNHLPNYANLSEHELYPLLAEYLKAEYNLKSCRIDEKRSGNQYQGRNHWLHPDIVAMQIVNLNKVVTQTSGPKVHLWSFEVKKELTISNVRESFFQALSNSNWADQSYLVAANISDKVLEELRMLSSAYFIGVIRLNTVNPSESQILLPSRHKPGRSEPDWVAMSRLAEENEDFKRFMEEVGAYKNTGHVSDMAWL